MPLFAAPEIPEDRQSDWSRFTPLFAPTPFRAEIVGQLPGRSDRAEFNLPRQPRDLRVVHERDAFLPAYVVETAGSGLLTYSALAAERDDFFEAVCRQVPAIHQMIDAEDKGDPREIWTAWLAGSQAGRGTLRQLPNGVWRATLRADAFEASRKLAAQPRRVLRAAQALLPPGVVWSDECESAPPGLLERALAMTRSPEVSTKTQLLQRATALARQPEVTEPSLGELRRHGERQGMHARVARLDALD